MYIDKIDSPADLKKFSIDEMNILAKEMRELIINKVNAIGGHMSPNLGIVETTLALHYVFNSPEDKIIFDVSHQCYPHKMLTGRKEGFLDANKYDSCSGYTAPEESEHDIFKIGHTSTSVSLAVGVAKARDLNNDNYNVIALIGDGSITGGEALEGLNNAATLGTNLIILLNDNEMSIAENHGGIYDNLKLLRDTNGQAECNIFRAIGFDYIYLDAGNDVQMLINELSKVKDCKKPTLVHIHTNKGCGFKFAEDNKEFTHWMSPHAIDEYNNTQQEESYCTITNNFILENAQKDKNIIAINAATPGVFGFDKDFREKLGQQYTDVGIAEEHAVAYASALAKIGAKPILAFMSSFVQRTYDQLSQDLALNKSPITMLIYWGGISSADATHLCLFDIPLISNIPDIVYLAPTCKEEYMAMLEYSVLQTKYPIAIRVPSSEMFSSGCIDNTDYSILNKSKVVENGSKIAILGVGSFWQLAKDLKDEIMKRFDISATLINPVFISGLDTELLESLKDTHSIVITLEDGIIDGGFGQKVASFYGASDMKVLNYGAKKEFTDRVSIDELYERYHLRKDLICDDLCSII